MPQSRIFGTPTLDLLASSIAPVDTPSPDLERIARVAESDRAAIHLAIFSEPFLGALLDGCKTIESRFSSRRIAPWKVVKEGDIVLIASRGSVVHGFVRVECVQYYELSELVLKSLREKYSNEVAADLVTDFWESRSGKNYCTLIWISRFEEVSDVKFSKRDRRGWVTFTASSL